MTRLLPLLLDRLCRSLGLIVSQCAYCRRLMGVKRGRGNGGVSHSICAKCVHDVWYPMVEASAQPKEGR